MIDLAAWARESFLVDVKSVGEELAGRPPPDGLAASLAELVELATDCRVLVSGEGDGHLVVTTSGTRLHLAAADVISEVARGADPRGETRV